MDFGSFFALAAPWVEHPAGFTVALVVLLFGLMAFTRIAPDIILIGGVALLLLVGILSPKEALSGLANEGMVTVGVLFIVGAGVRQTGGIDWIAQRLFGRPKSATGAIARLMLPTATLSAFMNNTPLVAMLIPAVSDWAKQHRISPSKLMIPLSYAAILGGTCTLIGTSTNLVVDGMLQKELNSGQLVGIHKEHFEDDHDQYLKDNYLGMLDITFVGLPAALIGCAFIVLASPLLLPDRKAAISTQDDPREYTVEMMVEAESPLVGKTIEEAGLRHLPGVFLAEIDRQGQVLPAVSPEEKLRGNDRLVFVGIVESVVDLQRIRGLMPATDQVFKLTSPRATRCLIEAVVSNTSPLKGKTIRDSRFRTAYNAVVVAVARNGERLHKKIGDIVVQAGDTLLLEASPSFVDQQRNSRDFFLVSRLEDSAPPRHDRAVLAISILFAMVLAVTLGWISMLKAGMLAAGAMLMTRCCSVTLARKSVDWEVLLAIAASFGIGEALQNTKADKWIADSFIGLAQGDPWLSLAVVYGVTLVVTELITNNAAAALMFPLAISTAQTLGVNYMPFVIVVMMAASAGFATPIGYQTNLMVYGPGGYRFSDYVKIGVPLDLLIWAVTVILAPMIWKFNI